MMRNGKARNEYLGICFGLWILFVFVIHAIQIDELDKRLKKIELQPPISMGRHELESKGFNYDLVFH